jgi:hypothetical protein
MRCLECGSPAVSGRPERTAQGYRRFRCRSRGKQFNGLRQGLSRVWGDGLESDLISSVDRFWPGDRHGVGFALGRNRARQRGAQC